MLEHYTVPHIFFHQSPPLPKNDSNKQLIQSQSKQKDKTEISTQYQYVRTISMIRSSEPDANISPSWLKLKVLTGQLQPDKRKPWLKLKGSLMYEKSNIIIPKWNDIWFHTKLTNLYFLETWAQLICMIKKYNKFICSSQFSSIYVQNVPCGTFL